MASGHTTFKLPAAPGVPGVALYPTQPRLGVTVRTGCETRALGRAGAHGDAAASGQAHTGASAPPAECSRVITSRGVPSRASFRHVDSRVSPASGWVSSAPGLQLPEQQPVHVERATRPVWPHHRRPAVQRAAAQPEQQHTHQRHPCSRAWLIPEAGPHAGGHGDQLHVFSQLGRRPQLCNLRRVGPA